MDKIYFEIFKSSKENLPFQLQLLHHMQGSLNWHDIPEFLYCLEGDGYVTIDAENINFTPGSLVIVNSNNVHATFSNSGLMKYYCLKINRAFFKENGIDIDNLQFEETLADNQVKKLIKEIFEIYFEQSGNPKYILMLKLKVLEFLYYLWENCTVSTDDKKHISDKSHRVILEAVKYINENYFKKLSLELLSDHFGYSKYHFARMFKKYTGKTVTEHINILRCEKAAVMLASTNSTIAGISCECGFDGQSYFTEIFRKNYGITPSEYRKSLKWDV